MGCQISKKIEGSSGGSSSNNNDSLAESSSNSRVTPDLSSYEAACRLDPDLQSFDSALRERTNRVISTLAVGAEAQSLSLDSLREVSGCFLEMNQAVVDVILDCKEDIWKSRELSDLVKEYLENSLVTMDFCTALEKSLKRARDGQLIVQVALQRFETERREGIDGGGERNCFAKTLQELRNFAAAGSPFTEEFLSLFQSVYRQQRSMLCKLERRKRKLDKKLKSIKSWRKVSNVIFVAAFAAVLICSVVAAAVSAPPVVTAVAAAASAAAAPMGKWINSLWKKYENEVKEERKIISTMRSGTYIAVQDIENIRVLVDKLVIAMESLVENAELALRDEEVVVLVIDETKKKLSGFMKAIDDLSEHADKFSSSLRMARSVILQRIIKYTNKD